MKNFRLLMLILTIILILSSCTHLYFAGQIDREQTLYALGGCACTIGVGLFTLMMYVPKLIGRE